MSQDVNDGKEPAEGGASRRRNRGEAPRWMGAEVLGGRKCRRRQRPVGQAGSGTEAPGSWAAAKPHGACRRWAGVSIVSSAGRQTLWEGLSGSLCPGAKPFESGCGMRVDARGSEGRAPSCRDQVAPRRGAGVRLSGGRREPDGVALPWRWRQPWEKGE